jgi:hypothetical protein
VDAFAEQKGGRRGLSSRATPGRIMTIS